MIYCVCNSIILSLEEQHCDDMSVKKLLVMYSYKADDQSPGGFTELTVKKGMRL